MYKNMVPADAVAREPHPMKGACCYAMPGDGAALQEQHERYLRLTAEFDNFRKRAAREAARRGAGQVEALVRDLLPVVDNLDRALTSSGPGSTDPLRQGVEMTFRQFVQAMRSHGFEPRDDVGKPFDPNYHEAVSTRSEPRHDHHAIVEVWQRGWMQGGRLFRPAKVVVNDLEAVAEEPTDQEGELNYA